MWIKKKEKLILKDHHPEIRLFYRRCFVSITLILIFTSLLIGRLLYLQVKQHAFYSTLSRQNLLTIIPVEPNRGLIYDRNGILLAQNIPAFSLALTPARISNLNDTIQKLRQLLPSITDHEVKFFEQHRNQYRPYQPVPLKLRMSEVEVAKFYLNQYRFPGVSIQARMIRYYPFYDLFSHVLGYIGRINQEDLETIDSVNYSASDYIGKVGIEKQYENLLHGTVGNEEVETDAGGHISRILKSNPPIPGPNFYITIDSKLQQVARNALGDESGAVVAMNPSNGEILALVSQPGYDPNVFVAGINQQSYQTLLQDPQHPLYNRDIRGLFPSGSTIKPFYALNALNIGAISPQFRLFDKGTFMLPNFSHVFHDWVKKGGHGWVNISRAITVSCDVFFYNLAVKVGIQRMDAALHAFGFGDLTGVDLPRELPGILPSPNWKHKAKGMPWFPGDTVNMGIGQGYFLITPLQLAQAISIIAERGKAPTPHLWLKAQNSDGKWITPTYPVRQAITIKNPANWDIVIQAMVNVIKDPSGTAHNFGKDAPYSVAGKTGTAQVRSKTGDEDYDDLSTPKAMRNNHLFIAFAPVENPQIAVAVIVEHSKGHDIIARKVMDYYFSTHSIPPPPPPAPSSTDSKGKPSTSTINQTTHHSHKTKRHKKAQHSVSPFDIF